MKKGRSSPAPRIAIHVQRATVPTGLPVVSSSGYRALLQAPAVCREAASGLLAQVTQGAAGVGIILVVGQHTASFTLAGAVVAALWIAAGVARPLQGRLIDRHGPAAVITLCGVLHGAALAGIVGFTSPGRAGLGAGRAGRDRGAVLAPGVHEHAHRVG